MVPGKTSCTLNLKVFSALYPDLSIQLFRIHLAEERFMAQDNKRSSFTMVLLLALFFQLVFIFADTRDTPGKAAAEFAKMYYQLDAAMSTRLCDELAQDEENNVVAAYIQNMTKEASERGFDVSYMRNTLYNVQTHTLKKDASSAEIRITGEMKKGINPLFAYVGKLFFLGKTTPLDQTVNVIMEGGKWKVCEGFFMVSES
jgi:hypothetical protein